MTPEAQHASWMSHAFCLNVKCFIFNMINSPGIYLDKARCVLAENALGEMFPPACMDDAYGCIHQKLGFYIVWSEGRGLLSLAVTLVRGERAERGGSQTVTFVMVMLTKAKKKKKRSGRAGKELHPFKDAIKVRSAANTPLIIIHPGHLLWKPAGKRWKHQMFLKVRCVKKSDVTLIGCAQLPWPRSARSNGWMPLFLARLISMLGRPAS